MFLDKFKHHLPQHWSSTNSNEEVHLIPLNANSREFKNVIKTMDQFPWTITDIFRVQNPYLYLQFILKMEEYDIQFDTQVLELFHATSQSNIPDIIYENLNWRFASRVKYGQGVSFSPSPVYANNRSNKLNGKHRAMILADVLVGRMQQVDETCVLPKFGYDTTIGDNKNTYVKYYDNEFYPKYVSYYEYGY